jgi:four helix bundle protein
MKRPYEKLITWQEAHQLCLMTYKESKLFPSDEKYGLTSQMRRSAMSVTSNIAEGVGRTSKAEKCRFYTIACASIEELHYQLVLSKDLQYLPVKIFDKIENQLKKTSYLLTRLRKSSIQQKSFSTPSSFSSSSTSS